MDTMVGPNVSFARRFHQARSKKIDHILTASLYKSIVLIITHGTQTAPLCRVIKVIGSGQFGQVSKGSWIISDKNEVQCAIKTLHNGASEDDQVKFLQEAAINGQFHHPNVVQLLGVVTMGEPVSSLGIPLTWTLEMWPQWLLKENTHSI